MGDELDCRRCGAPSPDGLCAACRVLEETVTLRPPGTPTDLAGAFTTFRIEEELGRGGMGTVYRALDLEAGEVRCLKVLRPGLALDEDFVGRLAQEAIAMAQLDHPAIVRFHRIGRESSFYYLLLEYVPGRDLGRLLDASGPLPVATVLGHVLEACRALEYAHARGIIHRDIKPSNLLIDPSGSVRLSDFGLARLLGAGSKRRITDTGTILGTIRFSAPELFEDAKRAGPAADQYSLAATAYFALSGQFPFPGRTLRDVLDRVDAGGVPIADRRPDVPAAVCEVLDRALARDPERRFESIAAFREALSRGSG